MAIKLRATNIETYVKNTYTTISGRYVESAEKVSMAATNGIFKIGSAQRSIFQSLNGSTTLGRKVNITPIVVPQAQPPKGTTLVKVVKGVSEAVPKQKVEYKVTEYNVDKVSNSERNAVKWVVKYDDKQENLNVQGEKVQIEIKREWAGKEITIMAYLNKPDEKTSQKTKVEKWNLPRLIARSKNWAGRKVDGSKAEDMQYNDCTEEDVLKISKLFKFQIKAKDITLFNDMKFLSGMVSVLGDKSNVNDIIAHFASNAGTNYSSQFLDNALKEHHTMNEFIYNRNGVVETLCKQLKETNGNINKIQLLIGKINSIRPKFNDTADYLNGLVFAVHDTSAYVIYIDEYELLSENTFNAKLRIEIYDNFGLGKDDIDKFSWGAGFRAWYVLQHVRGYKPFLTKMTYILDLKNQKI